MGIERKKVKGGRERERKKNDKKEEERKRHGEKMGDIKIDR
jgi:hypothetical protein